jgi:hypothetical protein
MGSRGTELQKGAPTGLRYQYQPRRSRSTTRQDAKRGVHRRMQLEQDRQSTRINTCIGALVHIVGCTLPEYQGYTHIPASALVDRP